MGGGRDGGGASTRNTPRLITALMGRAKCAQDVLAVVGDNFQQLDHIHVSMAFNRLGKMAKSRDFTPRHLTVDEGFARLLCLARDYARHGTSGSQSVANTTHGIAKLNEAGRLGATDGSVKDTLAALETAAGRVAREMNSQAVSNVLWAYATLGRMPGDDTWSVLETAARRVARDMNSQEVSNVIWGYAKLRRTPGDDTWRVLETAVGRVSRDMNSQEVSNVL